MTSLEAPASLEKKERKRFMHVIRQLYFWQGFFPEEPGYGLGYYIQELPPCIARVLLRHRWLRGGVTLLRSAHPWIVLTFAVLNSCIVHPVSIFLHFSDFDTVVDNAYPMVEYLFFVIATSCVFQRQVEIQDMLNEFDKLIKDIKLDNDQQRFLLNKTHIVCSRLVRVLHLIVVPSVWVFLLFYTIVGCLPFRKLYFEGWYPYNEKASPAYEITLSVSCIQVMLILLAGNTLISSIVILFCYVVVYLKIICNKFENIRIISFNAIKKRKISEMELRSQSLDKRLFEGNQLFRTARVGVNLPGMVTSQVFQPRGVPRAPQVPRRMRGNVRGMKIARGNVKVTQEEVDIEMRAQMAMFTLIHVKLLGIVRRINDALYVIFLDLFGINVIAYGGTLLLFMKIETLTTKIVIMLAVSFEIVLLYLVLNILANMISDQSAAVAEALYSSDWFEASPSFKRSMLIVMTRANVPVELKAPGVDPLSVKNFGQVANIAYKTANTLTTLR